MRFQVQEMARAERMLTDEAIADEVETYNELIPNPGELSGTLFIELTDDAQLREWLPKLRRHRVRTCHFELGARRAGRGSPAVPRDEERLTRDDITSTVHYLSFPFDAAAARRAGVGPGAVRVDHPEYQVWVELTDAQRAELAARLRGLSRWRSGSSGSTPSCRCRRQQHTDDAGLRPPRPRDASSSPPAVGARSCPPGSRSRSRPGYAGFVLPRSGLALKHGVTCLNTPGLIDPLYRGELKVLLVNTDPTPALYRRARRPHRAARDPTRRAGRVA